jgi:hypothetical protein
MKRITKVLFVGMLAGTVPAWGSAKKGVSYEIPADMLGVSYSSPTVWPDGLQLLDTVGPFGNLGNIGVMTSTGGYSFIPGLWGGGGITYNASSAELTYTFGDPAHPAKLYLAAGAIPFNYLLYTSTAPQTVPIRASPAIISRATANLGRSYTFPLSGQMYEINAQAPNGAYQTDLLKAPARLSLPYDDADNDGKVDGASPPVRVETLAVWWLDEAHSLWVKLPGSTVDRAARTVSATLRHFSVYSAMGGPSTSVDAVRPIPNPWRPNGPRAGTGAGETGTLAGGVLFNNLPSEGTLRIYTLSGELVREISHSDALGPTGQETWNGKNDSGSDVATGTYVYVFDAQGARKTGKVAVVR